MLPAAARMRHRESFQSTVRDGRRAGRPLLTVHLAQVGNDAPGSTPEIGFVVSRKVGNAVTRNRLRRQLRHVVRERLDRLEVAARGAAIVIRVAPRAVGATSAQLGAEFDRALDAVLAKGSAR